MNDFEKLLSDALHDNAGDVPDAVTAPHGLAASVRRRRARKIGVLATGVAGILGLVSVAGMTLGPDGGRKDVAAAPTTSAPETGDLAIPMEPSTARPSVAAEEAPTTEPVPDTAPGSTPPPTDPPPDSAPSPWLSEHATKAPPKDWPTPIPPGGFSYPLIDDVDAQAAGLRALVELMHGLVGPDEIDRVYIEDDWTYSDMLMGFSSAEKATLAGAVADLEPATWVRTPDEIPGATASSVPLATPYVTVGAAVDGPAGPQILMRYVRGGWPEVRVTFGLEKSPGGWISTGTVPQAVP